MYIASHFETEMYLRNYSVLRASLKRRAAWWGVKLLSWKVAGSNLDGIVDISNWLNPSGRAIALGSIQSLREMSTRDIYWGVKAAGA